MYWKDGPVPLESPIISNVNDISSIFREVDFSTGMNYLQNQILREQYDSESRFSVLGPNRP